MHHLSLGDSVNISDIAIAELIPHADNMVLLDRLLSADIHGAVAEFTAKNKGLFSAAPNVPAWVGIELMSQAIAAWAGYKARKNNLPVKLGFLIGTRRFQSEVQEFSAGSVFTIHVQRIFHDESGLASFDCEIKDSSGSILLSANINVYQPDEQQLQQMMEVST